MRYLKSRFSSLFLVVRVLACIGFVCPAAFASESPWPLIIETDRGTLTVFSPEFNSLKESVLFAQSALILQPTGDEEPSFGSAWLSARIEIDQNVGAVRTLDVKVEDLRFLPTGPKNTGDFYGILKDEIPLESFAPPLDALNAQLRIAERERQAAQNLRNLPPKVLITREPATLVMIDGEPELRPIENSRVMRVVNTPSFLLFDTTARRFYLYQDSHWFAAENIRASWTVTAQPPMEISVLEPKAEAGFDNRPVSDAAPRVLVATEPTEIIVLDGEPLYKMLEGNELLYLANTESDVLLDLGSQRHFVLLSGRWFSSWSLEGPWTYEPAHRLPKLFSKIPLRSAKGHLLSHIAGTPQAEEAVREGQIPRIAAIQRSEASLEVFYDGPPRFEPIAGTRMYYAVNSQTPVIELEQRYYAVQEGVWYEAEHANGPWILCDSVPDEIRNLPPESPLYHVKYVHVYHSTPETVYVGYTPGYHLSYILHGALVFGTGYTYSPWFGSYYYPWPYTWGFHARYDPWYGWGFGFGLNFGYWWWSPYTYYSHHHHVHYWGDHSHRDSSRKRHPGDRRRKNGWWGPGGYRQHDRERTTDEILARQGRTGEPRSRKPPKSKVERKSTTRKPEERRLTPSKRKRELKTKGFNQRDRIGPGVKEGWPREDESRDKIWQPRTNYFTDRLRRDGKTQPGPKREFPRHSPQKPTFKAPRKGLSPKGFSRNKGFAAKDGKNKIRGSTPRRMPGRSGQSRPRINTPGAKSHFPSPSPSRSLGSSRKNFNKGRPSGFPSRSFKGWGRGK